MLYSRSLTVHLKELIQQFPALILTGARQTGKTTLLQHIFPDYHYITLDLPSLAEMAENDPEQFLQQNPPPVIIDEAQYAPKLFRHLKYAIDQNRDLKGQYILTGSQKFNLMKEVSDSLAGRCVWLELEGLSLHEIQSHDKLALIDILPQLKQGDSRRKTGKVTSRHFRFLFHSTLPREA
jgi:predicted AAA+ superfamily ATPase